MHILITGGTGLIGTALTRKLLHDGHHVSILTRNPELKKDKSENARSYINNLSDLNEGYSPDVIINLAGAPISRRWTKSRKHDLINSRVRMTREVVAYIQKLQKKPRVLISGSAIGFYGNDKENDFTEESQPHLCFTHEVCKRWEVEAESAKKLTRVCYLRTGIVLSSEGGALKQMLPAFRLGLGGAMGDGTQWMSWIHIDDLIAIIERIIEDEKITGAINATSPTPVTNRNFTAALGHVLEKPTIFSMPEFVLTILFGEMAKALLLNGQRVIPKKMMDAGFRFKYPDLMPALENLLRNKS